MWIWGCSELYDQSQASKGYSVSSPTKIHPRGSPLQRHLHSFSSASSARNVFSILLPPSLFSLKCYMMPFNLLYSLEGAKVDFLWISMQFELFCSISASRVCQGHKSWDTKRCSQLSYAIFPEGWMHTQGVRYISWDTFNLNGLWKPTAQRIPFLNVESSLCLWWIKLSISIKKKSHL